MTYLHTNIGCAYKWRIDKNERAKFAMLASSMRWYLDHGDGPIEPITITVQMEPKISEDPNVTAPEEDVILKFIPGRKYVEVTVHPPELCPLTVPDRELWESLASEYKYRAGVYKLIPSEYLPPGLKYRAGSAMKLAEWLMHQNVDYTVYHYVRTGNEMPELRRWEHSKEKDSVQIRSTNIDLRHTLRHPKYEKLVSALMSTAHWREINRIVYCLTATTVQEFRHMLRTYYDVPVTRTGRPGKYKWCIKDHSYLQYVITDTVKDILRDTLIEYIGPENYQQLEKALDLYNINF